MEEIWKDIPGYEGKYQASSKGRIRSVTRLQVCKYKNGKKTWAWFQGKVLKLQEGTHGYPRVRIRPRPQTDVHIFVALAFLGPRPVGMEVLHKDGNRKNAKADNLRYGTRSENVYDVSRHDNQKISRDKILKVKSATGSLGEIAKETGVSKSHVKRIRDGEARIHG